jgi:hypothetical protein
MMIILSSWPWWRWWRVMFIVTISRILLLVLLVVMRWRIAMSITVIVYDMTITLIVNEKYWLLTLLPRKPL